VWATAYDIKRGQTLTEFLVTINSNQAFTPLDLVFLSIRALLRTALHELAIGYAYACCARFGEARHLVGTGEDNNDQTPNVLATIF
jgi:hypothetical protein